MTTNPTHSILKRLQAVAHQQVNLWSNFKKMASLLGKRSANALLDEINPDRVQYKFGVGTLIELMRRTTPTPYLTVLAGEFGHIVLPPLDVARPSDSTERLMLGIGGGVGLLQKLWLEFTHPHSAGGEQITNCERQALTEAINQHLTQVYQARRALDSTHTPEAT